MRTMINHSLVCLLKDDKKASFKTVKASSNPTVEKVKDIYFNNVEVLEYIVNYCKNNDIKSLRVSSSLFPLITYAPYREKLYPLLEEVGKEYEKIDFSGLELSSHPDQFVLLSSLNENINANSRYDLEIYALMSKYIPWNLVNIHVGSKADGLETHAKIFKKEVSLLSKEAKDLISIENDEKSYSFLETLEIAENNGLMMVPDFHHERCMQKRKENNGLGLSLEEHIKWNEEIDSVIYENLNRVLATYKGRNATPTFHISSPVNGWNGNFKDQCQHSDYIAALDYPKQLQLLLKERKIEVRLDIEAKAKNEAIFQLRKELIV